MTAVSVKSLNSVEVVVSAYNETDDVCPLVSGLVERMSNVWCTVYDKGDQGIAEMLNESVRSDRVSAVGGVPNVGREAHTFLWHVAENYDVLADATVFLQGNPWDHIDPRVDIKKVRTRNIEDYFKFVDGPVGKSKTILEIARKKPNNISGIHVRVADAAKMLGEDLARDLPCGKAFCFRIGAQYAVSRERLRRRPRDWWIRAAKLAESEQINAWEFERIWPSIYNIKIKPNAEDVRKPRGVKGVLLRI